MKLLGVHTGRYILVGETPMEEPDLLTWNRWFESADRTVRRTEIDDVVISTVFLRLDHQFGEGPPLLFETMIFTNGQPGDIQCRYETWGNAVKGHYAVVSIMSKVKNLGVAPFNESG